MKHILKGFLITALMVLLLSCTFPGDAPPNGSSFGGMSSEFFDDSTMHAIEITIDPDIFQMILNEHKDGDPDRDYRLATSFTFDGQTVQNVGIRGRGNTSRDNLKRQFKISFDCTDPFNTDQSADVSTKASFPGNDNREFLNVRKLNLRASKNDPTLIREFISYKMYREMGVLAPQASMAKVTVNGVNQGVYTIVEQLDKQFVKVWFDNDENDGNLYKGMYGSDFSPGSYDSETYQLKTNKSVNNTSDITSFISQLNNTTSYNSLSAIVDMDNLLGYLAVSHGIGHWDADAGNSNNDYIYHNPVNGKWYVAVWDCDNTFGSDWAGSTLSKDIHGPLNGSGTVILTKAMSLATTRYDQKLTEFANAWHPDMTTTFNTEVDRIKNLIATEVANDPHLVDIDDWHDSYTTGIPTNNTPFDETVNQQYDSGIGLKNYFQQRMDFIVSALGIATTTTTTTTVSSTIDVSISIQGGLPQYNGLYHYTSNGSVTVELTGTDLGTVTSVDYDVYEILNGEPDTEVFLTNLTPGSSPWTQAVPLTTADNLYTMYRIRANYTDGSANEDQYVDIWRFNPTPASPAVSGDDVTFYYFNGFHDGSDTVFIRGGMNSWALTDEMTWNGSQYVITITGMTNNQYEYKFYNQDEDEWYADPHNYKLDYAGNHNSILDK
jgi:spore coat protein CotH